VRRLLQGLAVAVSGRAGNAFFNFKGIAGCRIAVVLILMYYNTTIISFVLFIRKLSEPHFHGKCVLSQVMAGSPRPRCDFHQMIAIYAIRMDGCTDYASLEKLLPFLPVEKQRRIERFVHQVDAIRSLLGEWIIRFVLCSRYELSLPAIQVACDGYGKPFLEDQPELFFNISHSGEWVVCALSKQPVGIDVEKIAPINMGIARHYFSRSEYSQLMELPVVDRLEYFYTLWTLKESYLKAVGKGLALGLDSITISNRPANNTVFQVPEMDDFYFSSCAFFAGYKLAVCGKEDRLYQPIELLEYTEIAGHAKAY
jgi:4'-phosphopantetheinyl transferase